jgi:uncharacterized protein (TIGR02302 family)
LASWKVEASRAFLGWERLWPALLPAAAPFFLIAVLGLFDVWNGVTPTTHGAVLLGALMVAGAVLWRKARSFRWPTRMEALARLEAGGELDHAPLRTLEDRPFAAEAGSALWRAHLQDMRRAAKGARLRAPRPEVDASDPWSLRYGALGLLAIALVAAGPETGARFLRAFTPGALQSAALAETDLWIEPPAYTGKAPIYLLRSGEAVAGLREQTDAPQSSLVVAQTSTKKSSLKLVTEKETMEAAASPDQKGRFTLKLERSGLLQLRAAGKEGRWPIGVLADDAPSVGYIDNPSSTDDARLALLLSVEDDYGVVSARLKLRLDPDQERPLDAPEFDVAALRERRTVEIDGVAGRSGERQLDVDLLEDPWAGLSVFAIIEVTDGAGQTGATAEARVTLPAKPFFNPLAKAVIEQRQTLAVSAEDWRRAWRSFDALTLAPDRFYETSADYLLMRTAFWRVMRQDGGGFSDAVKEFWPLALQLEDEALELARQRLQAAQDALREALERGAGEEEISRLVEDLRASMQQYLAALQQSGQRPAEETGRPSETLESGELEQMLDQIRDLSQSGARGAARQALADLENILRNLRLSGGGGQGQGSPGQGQGGAAGEAGDLIGRQRDLANRSFERGQSGGEGDDLGDEQGGLAGDLSKMLESLEDGKSDPNGEAREALGEALRDMRDAEDALRTENFDAAGAAMERAVASLREGAGALAEQEGAEQRGREAQGARGPATDPLGRPMGEAYGRGVEVPEGWDAQAAQKVLEELRRRLSDGKRSEDEIRYLERLLERF